MARLDLEDPEQEATEQEDPVSKAEGLGNWLSVSSGLRVQDPEPHHPSIHPFIHTHIQMNTQPGGEGSRKYVKASKKSS